MNPLFRPPSLPPTTQAAEGLVRRRRSVAGIDARRLGTRVMREPGPEERASIVECGPKQRLDVRFAPSLGRMPSELELV